MISSSSNKKLMAFARELNGESGPSFPTPPKRVCGVYLDQIMPTIKPKVIAQTITTELPFDYLLKTLTLYVPVILMIIVYLNGFVSAPGSCTTFGNSSFTSEFLFAQCLSNNSGISDSVISVGSRKVPRSNGIIAYDYLPVLIFTHVILLATPYVCWQYAFDSEIRAQILAIGKEYHCIYHAVLKEVKEKNEFYGKETKDLYQYLKELPLFDTIQVDWSLNSYIHNLMRSSRLKDWYMIKHLLSWLLHMYGVLLPLLGLANAKDATSSGLVLADFFYCKTFTHRQTVMSYCVVPQARIMNFIILLYLAIFLIAIIIQLFYILFYVHRLNQICSNKTLDASFVEKNFFTHYLLLKVYAKYCQKYYLSNVQHIYVNANPMVMKTDFFLMSLLLSANSTSLSSYPVFTHWVQDRFMAATGRKIKRVRDACYPVEQIETGIDSDLITFYA